MRIIKAEFQRVGSDSKDMMASAYVAHEGRPVTLVLLDNGSGMRYWIIQGSSEPLPPYHIKPDYWVKYDEATETMTGDPLPLDHPYAEVFARMAGAFDTLGWETT